jgi:hypothetical protein
MLASPGFSHNAVFAHLALHQQRLAQRVVDFVRAGVGQVFTLDVDAWPAQMVGQPPRIGHRRRSADEGAQQMVELCLKFRVVSGFEIDLFQLIRAPGSTTPARFTAVRAKMARFIGPCTVRKRRAALPGHSAR